MESEISHTLPSKTSRIASPAVTAKMPLWKKSVHMSEEVECGNLKRLRRSNNVDCTGKTVMVDREKGCDGKGYCKDPF
jgi:hypothetical protein